MFEELLGKDEVHPEQIYPKIYIGKTPLVDISVCHKLVENLDEMSKEQLRDQLLDIANFRSKELVRVG